MPGKREFAQHLIGEIAHAKARHETLKVAPVQDVQFAERDTAGTDLLHAGLVFGPPGVGKGRPVQVIPKRLQEPFGLAGDPRPPVDEGPEHVEEHRPNGGHDEACGLIFQRRLKSAVESKDHLERLATSLSAAEQLLSNFTASRLMAFARSGRVWRVQLLPIPTTDALGEWLRLEDLTQYLRLAPKGGAS
jgi:hypothetical protein